MNSKIKICIATIALIFFTFSCKDKGEEYHSLTDKIEAESKHYHGISISSDAYLVGEDLMEITEGEHTFLIPKRKDKITAFACTECHATPLEEIAGKDYKRAHWDIKVVHANTNTMNCATCHNTSNMDELKSLTGKSIDFNRSYNLCSQCHTTQFKDWKGGAHGKELGGWAPPRASMTCVNCHNPHKPAIEKRWPVQFNSQIQKERE